jgi:hypothetical protein
MEEQEIEVNKNSNAQDLSSPENSKKVRYLFILKKNIKFLKLQILLVKKKSDQ